MDQNATWLEPGAVYCADARELARFLHPESVELSVWSPPYHVGKQYERDMSFVDWKNLLRRTIVAHMEILKPGAFLAINIADILCFKDSSMPKIMAENISRRKRSDITREKVLAEMAQFPELSRYEIATRLGCS
ncbi:MAG: DNA methyltransferase, partial [Methylococcales bacterium]